MSKGSPRKLLLSESRLIFYIKNVRSLGEATRDICDFFEMLAYLLRSIVFCFLHALRSVVFYCLVSFDHVTGHSKTINDDEDSHRHSTLYAIIISCSLFICFTICAVSVFFVRRRQNENRTLTFSNRTYDERASSNAITGNEKCELLYISKEKNNCYHQQRYEPTTSARLFSMYSDDNADTGNEETSPSMDGFASYVRVSISQGHK